MENFSIETKEISRQNRMNLINDTSKNRSGFFLKQVNKLELCRRTILHDDVLIKQVFVIQLFAKIPLYIESGGYR